MQLTYGILAVVFTLVVAPPPLDVELRAKKDYLEQLKHAKEDTLDIHGDNLIPDTEETAVEDTEAVDRFELLKHDEAQFVPMAVPSKFKKYDTNDDDFIDEGELITVLGVSENIALALKDADQNGDGLLSRDEFENSPWDLDADDLPGAEDMDDSIGEDAIDEEFIDYDSDTFNEIIDEEGDENDDDDDENDDKDDHDDNADDESDDYSKDVKAIDNEIIDDLKDNVDDLKENLEEIKDNIKEQIQDIHEEVNLNGENEITEKVEDVAEDVVENVNDVKEKINDIHSNLVDKISGN